MILTQEDIIEILKDNQSIPEWVIKARNNNSELEALVNGVDFESLLIKIEGKEDNEKILARKKYSRSIKDLFERLLRPIDYVYSSTGGSKKYNEKVDTDVILALSKLTGEKPLEHWAQNNWMPLYHTDPNGIIIYEWKDDKCWPTYKNIHKVRCYKATGQKLEWVLFEPCNEEGEKEFRLIDDAYDYTIKQNGESFTIDDDDTYENPFRKCPGIVISDLMHYCGHERKSPIEKITEIAKEYLRDQSIKTLYKFLHGFPIFWRYVVQCEKCHGTGKIGTNNCPDCNGVGFYMKKDVTDMVTLPVPKNNDDIKIAPDIAGYIAPELKTWDQYIKELDLLFSVMNETHWGADIKSQAIKTATEVYSNYQPVISRLNKYADTAEWVEWYLTELALNFLNPIKNADDSYVSVLYGRNYIIEPINVLLERYQKSKEAGDSTAILDKQLYEWIVSKYKSDPETLSDELKRIQVEPFVHYTVKDVFDYYGPKQAKEKMMFSAFWSSIDRSMKTVDQLKAEYEKYKININ